MFKKYKIFFSLLILFNCCLDENCIQPDEENIDDSSVYIGRWINAIETDSKNNLWLGKDSPGAVYKLAYDKHEWLKTNLNNFDVAGLFISENDDIFTTRYYFYFHPDSSIMKSSDGGETWLPIGIPEFGFSSLTETDENVLFAGSRESIYYSNDNGTSWNRIQLPLVDGIHIFANELTVDNKNNFWIELKGEMGSKLLRYNYETLEYKFYGSLSHINKIFISKDCDVFIAHQLHDEAGGSISRVLAEADTIEWMPMNHTKSFGLSLRDISFYKDEYIIAASSEGIQLSRDKGETWSQMLPDSSFTAIEVDNNNIVYAGTVNGYVIKIAEIEKLIGL